MRLLPFALALIVLSSAVLAAKTSNIQVLPNVPTILSSGNESAAAIIYAPTPDGAYAAFISNIIILRDGQLLQNGDMLHIYYDANGLSRITAGEGPDRSAWVDLPVQGYTGGANITQKVYSSESGYESNFFPSMPLSAKGMRTVVEYANDWWLIGDMNADNRSVLLYQEAAYGRISPQSNLSAGPYGLSFLLFDGEKVLVGFRGGLEKTYFSARQFNDASTKRLTVWADYNDSAGPLPGADCYLEGDVRGSLSLINNRYKGVLDYSYMPQRDYSYAVSCSKDGYEPKTLVLKFSTVPQQAAPEAPAAPSVQSQTQMGPASSSYVPVPEQPTILQQLDRLLKDPFWWLRGN